MNIIETPKELSKFVECLKKEFEMKDLGKTKFCLGLQIEHLTNEIFIHQSTYTEKVLKRFYMDKSHPLSTPMVVRSLDINKDSFRPQESDEEVFDDETTYLNWGTNVPCQQYPTRYLFCSLFIVEIQLMSNKKTFERC